MSSKVEGSTAPDVTWTGGALVQGFGPRKLKIVCLAIRLDTVLDL